jgi:hypothetical protein
MQRVFKNTGVLVKVVWVPTLGAFLFNLNKSFEKVADDGIGVNSCRHTN